jgi:hypothetical protein
MYSNSEQKTTSQVLRHFVSLQHNFGVAVFSLLFGIDTCSLFLFLFGSNNFAAQLVSILFSVAFIPISFVVVKVLQILLRSPRWDFCLLYPFIVLSALPALYLLYLVKLTIYGV